MGYAGISYAYVMAGSIPHLVVNNVKVAAAILIRHMYMADKNWNDNVWF